MSKEPDQPRRHFLSAAILAVAAGESALVNPASAQSATGPGTVLATTTT